MFYFSSVVSLFVVIHVYEDAILILVWLNYFTEKNERIRLL